MKKLIFLILFGVAAHSTLMGQRIEQVTIGVNGLHCSACSFTVEKSLMKVDFVNAVLMDLNKREGNIIIDDKAEIDFRKLAKAVTDAGYSVRNLVVTFNDEIDQNTDCLTVANNNFCVLPNGVNSNEIILMDKEFVPKKERKKMNLSVPDNCNSCGILQNRYLAQWN